MAAGLADAGFAATGQCSICCLSFMETSHRDGAETGQGSLIPLRPCVIPGVGEGRAVPKPMVSLSIHLPNNLQGAIEVGPSSSLVVYLLLLLLFLLDVGGNGLVRRH